MTEPASHMSAKNTNGWPKRPLGDLTQNFDGQRVPVREADRTPGPFPYYGASGIVDYVDRYIFDGEYLLVAEDGENLKTRNTPVAFLARGKFWVNNHAHIVKGNSEADTRFLMYVLNNTDISGYLTGSTMPKLTQGNLNRIPLVAPPLSDQRAISHILGTLDDKVELKRQMNETLEAMAQALFKSWFVDFDPVRAKMDGRVPVGMDAETAALFPDRLVDSEIGEIPEGWEVGRLSDLCTTQYGYTASAIEEPVGPKFLRVMDINKKNWIDWDSVPHCQIDSESKAAYALHIGDLVVARMADPGKSAIVEEDLEAVFASYLVRLKTDSLALSYYLFYFLKSERYLDYAKGAKSGSVQASMNAKVIVGTSLTVPSQELMTRFLQSVLPLRHLLVRNTREICTLSAIRSTLLPKLLSGALSSFPPGNIVPRDSRPEVTIDWTM